MNFIKWVRQDWPFIIASMFFAVAIGAGLGFIAAIISLLL